MPPLIPLRAARALPPTDDLLQAAFDDAVVGMVLRQPGVARTVANRAFCDFIGYTADELEGIDPCSLSAPEERATDEALRARMLQGHTATHRRRKRFVHKDGRLLWADFSCRLVPGRQGRPGYFLAQVLDITAAQRAQADLEAANRELEAFAYSIAHDLRAPMAAVDGFGRLLRQRLAHAGSDERHYVARILDNVRRMGELTDALLSLASLPDAPLERGPVDLGAMARELSCELAEAGALHAPRLHVAGALRVQGDARLLRQALANLLANAWKFTARSARPEVEFGRLDAAEGGLPVFYLRDNGVGFDMRDAAGLFQPFRRLHAQGDFPGTGIGLAVVHKVIERHGGRVWAEAAPGRGATFFFTLPDAG